MKLIQEQLEMLNGKHGKTKAKVMSTLVRYGKTFEATEMVPVTGKYNHLVTSFGLSALKPVYKLLDELIEDGAISSQKFSVDPRPLDKNVPSNLIQKVIFKLMYSAQTSYEERLVKLGLMDSSAFTCTCYMDEVGNIPKYGDVLSWSESSAVVYANSVLGARCNRNSGIIDIFGSIAGFVPRFGFLTDEGRKATWIIEIRTSQKPEAQILGSAIGMKVMEEVPYIKGLDLFLGNELTDDSKSYLKDMGAAMASNGAVGLFHIEELTPEAVLLGRNLISENRKVYIIDDKEIQRVMESYPVMWKKSETRPKLAFIGCPHLSFSQLVDWTEKLGKELRQSKKSSVAIPTVFTAAPAVCKHFEETEHYEKLKKTGVILSSICPLMYMNNPMSAKYPIITNSNKLRTYSTSRYLNDQAILTAIVQGGIIK